jgi:hypothetical protein
MREASERRVGWFARRAQLRLHAVSQSPAPMPGYLHLYAVGPSVRAPRRGGASWLRENAEGLGELGFSAGQALLFQLGAEKLTGASLMSLFEDRFIGWLEDAEKVRDALRGFLSSLEGDALSPAQREVADEYGLAPALTVRRIRDLERMISRALDAGARVAGFHWPGAAGPNAAHGAAAESPAHRFRLARARAPPGPLAVGKTLSRGPAGVPRKKESQATPLMRLNLHDAVTVRLGARLQFTESPRGCSRLV